MINKKGFLLGEQTVKIIIAIIVLIILFYLLFALYLAQKEAEDLRKAKASLEYLIKEVEDEKTLVEIYNPTYNTLFGSKYYWFMFTWPTRGDGIMPQKCSTLGWSNCVCICGSSIYKDMFGKQWIADMCDSKGICLEFTDLKINQKNGFLSQGKLYSYDDLLALINPPVELIIDYNKKEITER